MAADPALEQMNVKLTEVITDITGVTGMAIIVYHMLKERRPYQDQGAAYYEARYRERLVEGLRRRAKPLGLDLVSLAPAE